MEKEIYKRMERFVELSAKFSKEEQDLFPKMEYKSRVIGADSISYDSSLGYGHTCASDGVVINGTLVLNNKEIYTDGYGHVKSRDLSEPTRADEIRERARALAKLSDEFDEYNKLRDDLSSYFKSINNLIE